MKIPAFYINLDSDASRRQRIERELERAGLKAERLAGVNGVDVPPLLERFFFENGAPASNLTPGEVGCYASHLKAMQLVLHRGLDWALILEDDARLHTRLAEIIESAIERVPAGWDFIKLCRYSRAVRPLRKLAAGRMLVRYNPV